MKIVRNMAKIEKVVFLILRSVVVTLLLKNQSELNKF
jgi:hypothetical protein